MNKDYIYFFIGIVVFAVILSTSAHSYEVEARVVSYEPIMKEETVYIPHEQCYKKKQKIYTVTHPAGEGTRLGGQFGHDVATLSSPLSQTSGMVITLGGALIGHLFEREKNSHYIETPVCEVRHTPERKTTIDGFLVTYEYKGQYYQTRTKVKPGTRIRIVIKHEVQ